MGYAVLYSGGKDSSLALWKAQERGLEIDVLISVFPERADSYMFHRPNIGLVPQLADSLGIDMITVKTCGEKELELNELVTVFNELDIDGVVTGAVASSYQRQRVDKMCKARGLVHFMPLWGMEQEDILKELINNNFRCVIVAVAAMGLDDSWLGKELDKDTISELKSLEKRYKINVAGEGGEYESLVLGAPNYNWDFQIGEAKIEWDGQRGTLEVIELKKEEK